jgi:hypothetical protein
VLEAGKTGTPLANGQALWKKLHSNLTRFQHWQLLLKAKE